MHELDLRQSFVNTAAVAGAASSGRKVRDRASAPVRVSAPFVPPARPAIRIVKGPNSQRTGYGETARFRITVTNTGNVRLRNVKVADPSSPGCNRGLGTLAAGASKSYFCTRPNVTKSFLNRAGAVGTAPNGRRVTDTDSAAVTTKKPAFTGRDLNVKPPCFRPLQPSTPSLMKRGVCQAEGRSVPIIGTPLSAREGAL